MYTGILFAFPLGLKETYNDDIYFLSVFLSLPSRKNSVCMVELYSFLKRILTQNIFLMSEHDFFQCLNIAFWDGLLGLDDIECSVQQYGEWAFRKHIRNI